MRGVSLQHNPPRLLRCAVRANKAVTGPQVSVESRERNDAARLAH